MLGTSGARLLSSAACLSGRHAFITTGGTELRKKSWSLGASAVVLAGAMLSNPAAIATTSNGAAESRAALACSYVHKSDQSNLISVVYAGTITRVNPSNDCAPLSQVSGHENWDLWCWHKNANNAVWWYGTSRDSGSVGWVHKNDFWATTLPDYTQRPNQKC